MCIVNIISSIIKIKEYVLTRSSYASLSPVIVNTPTSGKSVVIGVKDEITGMS